MKIVYTVGTAVFLRWAQFRGDCEYSLKEYETDLELGLSKRFSWPQVRIMRQKVIWHYERTHGCPVIVIAHSSVLAPKPHPRVHWDSSVEENELKKMAIHQSKKMA